MGVKAILIEEINERLPINSKLKAVKYIDCHVSTSGNTRRMVFCQCECGNTKNCVVGDLIRGNPLSCGCSKRGRKQIHTEESKILYKKWQDMRGRCYDEKNYNYKTYGAKGVRICDEWLNDFNCFFEWSLSNGYVIGLELDKDILGAGKLYSPATCKWVTHLENMSATSKTVRFNLYGEMLTLPEISRKHNILQSVLKGRIKAGKTIQEAVEYKPEPKFKKYSND